MNIQVIAEHSLDLDLLPKEANILDIGSRGFLFANELRRMGHDVITVDCDPKVGGNPLWHYQLAISNYNGSMEIIRSKDPQATRVIPVNAHSNEVNIIECMTLEAFSEMVGIEFWDLIKIDVEGSEYDIIMSLDKAPARQLSIEFHLHTGIYGIIQLKEMEQKLGSLGYELVRHEISKQHGLGYNFWDSLFTLK